jgi:hypothetical protein
MKQFILITCLFIISCSQEKDDWQDASKYYKCTKEQMEKVEHEAKWCADNTNYISTYCYGSAIMRNCEPNINIKKGSEK